MSSTPNIKRVERAYAQQRGVGSRRARESVRQGISALMETHNIGYQDGIALFAQKHGLDASAEADQRRRGALPLIELIAAGRIKVGDRVTCFTQKTGRIPARVGPEGTIVVDGAHYPGPLEAITAVGGIAYGVAAWQKWRHESSKKTLLDIGVELIQKERQQ